MGSEFQLWSMKATQKPCQGAWLSPTMSAACRAQHQLHQHIILPGPMPKTPNCWCASPLSFSGAEGAPCSAAVTSRHEEKVGLFLCHTNRPLGNCPTGVTDDLGALRYPWQTKSSAASCSIRDLSVFSCSYLWKKVKKPAPTCSWPSAVVKK